MCRVRELLLVLCADILDCLVEGARMIIGKRRGDRRGQRGKLSYFHHGPGFYLWDAVASYSHLC